MFPDILYPARMSSAVAKVAKPVMRGMHVQVTRILHICSLLWWIVYWDVSPEIFVLEHQEEHPDGHSLSHCNNYRLVLPDQQAKVDEKLKISSMNHWRLVWKIVNIKYASLMLVWILIDWSGARIQAYKDFYANYDAEKDFQRMKASITYVGKFNLCELSLSVYSPNN